MINSGLNCFSNASVGNLIAPVEFILWAVFHFDLYSTALSKIERGTGEDISDVIALLQNGQLEMAELTRYFEEILPRFATDSLKQNPAEFREKFNAFTKMWQTTNQ